MKKVILFSALLLMLCSTGLFAQTTVFQDYTLDLGDVTEGYSMPAGRDSLIVEGIWTHTAAPENGSKVYIYNAVSQEGHTLGGGVLVDSLDYATGNGATHYEIKRLVGMYYVQFRLDASANPSDTSRLDINIRAK